MRGLKSLVIGMGVLILVGLTVVIVTVINRYDNQNVSSVENTLGSPTVPIEMGFGEKRVSLPQGARVVETIVDGRHIVLRLDLSDGEQALLLLDMTVGRRIGLIRMGHGT